MRARPRPRSCLLGSFTEQHGHSRGLPPTIRLPIAAGVVFFFCSANLNADELHRQIRPVHTLTNQTELTSPPPLPCEPRASLGGLSTLSNRLDPFLFPNSGQTPCREHLPVVKLFPKVTGRDGRYWSPTLLSQSSCSRSFIFCMSSLAGMTWSSSEHPPEGPATATSALGCLSDLYDMSTVFPTLP